MALKKLGFLTEDMKVTNIGRCAAHILSCDSTVLITWLKVCMIDIAFAN